LNLRELLPGELVLGNPGAVVGSLAFHPSQARSDTLFFKCHYPGVNVTAAEAIARGARYVVLQQGDSESLPPDITRTYVQDVNRTFAVAAARFFGQAHRDLMIIGVTGTKGKSTVCHLLEAALRHAGLRTGLVTSLTRRLPRGESQAKGTTPAPPGLHRFLQKARRQGVTHVILEVSSIGIAEARVHGLHFAALAFTNLGSDHLEYHGGREAYLATKQRLFSEASPDTICAINTDDAAGRAICGKATGRIVTFGLRDADLVPESWCHDGRQMRLRVDGCEIQLPFFGEHNVYNALAAIAIARDVLGSTATAMEAMQNATPLAGRLERAPTELDVDVYIDYAHTPESVDAALRAVAAVSGSRKRIAVVGCSANSDHGKRPLIAHAAAAGADVCILTSDNPDFEDPSAIMGEMLAGLDAATAASGRVRTIADRAEAIAVAIDMAMPDGTVIVMGKGSERVQLVGGERLPHSDLEIAANLLRTKEARTRFSTEEDGHRRREPWRL
jgi:UDP-N-acetylmuramoyl-L-alanyl-D-glutamate--2,6-diaminopimelate ligase